MPQLNTPGIKASDVWAAQSITTDSANLGAAAEYLIPAGKRLKAVSFQDVLFELQLFNAGVSPGWKKTDHTWTADEWTLVDVLSDGANVKLVNGAGSTKQYRIQYEN